MAANLRPGLSDDGNAAGPTAAGPIVEGLGVFTRRQRKPRRPSVSVVKFSGPIVVANVGPGVGLAVS